METINGLKASEIKIHCDGLLVTKVKHSWNDSLVSTFHSSIGFGPLHCMEEMERQGLNRTPLTPSSAFLWLWLMKVTSTSMRYGAIQKSLVFLLFPWCLDKRVCSFLSAGGPRCVSVPEDAAEKGARSKASVCHSSRSLWWCPSPLSCYL